MTFLKTLSALMLALACCAGVRADDTPCESCKKCKEEKPKSCGNPIKNFFVHKVGGTINSGLKQVPCKFEGAYATSANAVNTTVGSVKTDCGCAK